MGKLNGGGVPWQLDSSEPQRKGKPNPNVLYTNISEAFLVLVYQIN